MAILEQLDASHIDAAIFQLGEEVWHRMRGERPGLFRTQHWQGRLLAWVMRDPSFKVDLFRFVDVLPTLSTTSQVAQHVREYLLKDGRDLPGVMSTALKAASSSLTAGLAARTIKKNVTNMAARFIVGRDPDHALPVLRTLHQEGIACSVDLLGEATCSEVEAEVYQARYLALIDRLADDVSQWPAAPTIDENHLGPIPRANVSLKISALDSQLDAVDPAGSVSRLKDRVLPIFLRAKDKNVFLNVDLERWALHGITYDLFEDILSHPALRTWPPREAMSVQPVRRAILVQPVRKAMSARSAHEAFRATPVPPARKVMLAQSVRKAMSARSVRKATLDPPARKAMPVPPVRRAMSARSVHGARRVMSVPTGPPAPRAPRATLDRPVQRDLRVCLAPLVRTVVRVAVPVTCSRPSWMPCRQQRPSPSRQ